MTDDSLEDPATVDRHAAALQYYLTFCSQSAVAKIYPHAACVNRGFRLEFTAYLAQCPVMRDSRNRAAGRSLKGQGFILQTVRALYEWAADPDRGNALAEGFRNPFRKLPRPKSLLKGEPLAEPDISLAMAIEFIAACDRFQLRLFVPMLIFGLRPRAFAPGFPRNSCRHVSAGLPLPE